MPSDCTFHTPTQMALGCGSSTSWAVPHKVDFGSKEGHQAATHAAVGRTTGERSAKQVGVKHAKVDPHGDNATMVSKAFHLWSTIRQWYEHSPRSAQAAVQRAN